MGFKTLSFLAGSSKFCPNDKLQKHINNRNATVLKVGVVKVILVINEYGIMGINEKEQDFGIIHQKDAYKA